MFPDRPGACDPSGARIGRIVGPMTMRTVGIVDRMLARLTD